ncbi:MAG: acetate/propionate family kinase [Acidobacteriota bacterium]
MQLLVINSGSSSIKFSVYAVMAEGEQPQSLLDGQLSDIGERESRLVLRQAGRGQSMAGRVGIHGVSEAISVVLDVVSGSGMPGFEAVGYRVVHPGPRLHEHTRITPQVLAELDAAGAYAPLHDPAAVQMIRTFSQRFPELPQYACFDTVFHHTMPLEASTYALPPEFMKRGVRRYGFHGLSCESIVQQLRSEEGRNGPLPRRMVIAHLGSGCSVTALQDGRSVDTTMGLTPTGGVVMGTRPGDLDPGLVLFLLREEIGAPQDGGSGSKDALDAVQKLLNHGAGLAALSGMENSVKEIRAAANAGRQSARLALQVFTRSVRKAMGAFCWLLGGLDAVVFSGGVGENDAQTRQEIIAGMEDLGVSLDPGLNHRAAGGIQRISPPDSPTQVLIVPAQEDQMVAAHVFRMATEE